MTAIDLSREFGKSFSQVARRTTDSLSNLTERLYEADVGTALKSSLTNIYFARTVLSLLIIAFGLVCSILFVKYTNRNDAKKQQQLSYITRLWFGENRSGLVWSLTTVWLGSLLVLLAAPLISKIFQVFRMGKVSP